MSEQFETPICEPEAPVAAAPICTGSVAEQTVETIEAPVCEAPAPVCEPQPVVEYVKPIETVVAHKSRLPLVGALAALALAGGLGYGLLHHDVTAASAVQTVSYEEPMAKVNLPAITTNDTTIVPQKTTVVAPKVVKAITPKAAPAAPAAVQAPAQVVEPVVVTG